MPGSGVSCACFLSQNMYTLHTFDNSKLTFTSLCALLYHLEDFKLGQNPYAENLEACSVEHDGEIYPLVMSSHFFVSVRIPVTDVVKQIEAWMDEMATAIFEPCGTPRLPAQMLREEWGAVQSLYGLCGNGLDVFDTLPTFPILHGQVPVHNLTQLLHRIWSKRMGYGVLGPEFAPGMGVNSRHDVHVAYALARGDDVPQRVIDQYKQLGQSERFDMRWMSALLENDALRGRFKSVEHLSAAHAAFHREGQKLDGSNVDATVSALAHLPESTSHAAVDDALYAAGFLKDAPPIEVLPREPDEPAFNDFACALREDLAQYRLHRSMKALDDRRASGNVSLRQYKRELAFLKANMVNEPWKWPNRVARALDRKDLPSLLSILDGSGNDVSQRAVEAAHGVKLRNVTAKERRRAIFAIAGFVDDAAVAAEEARLDKRKRELALEREFTDAHKAASEHSIRVDGGEVRSCASFVDDVIARGFNKLEAHGTGTKVKYYLSNMDSRHAYRVKKADGTYQYARLLLERLAAGQPVPAAQDCVTDVHHENA